MRAASRAATCALTLSLFASNPGFAQGPSNDAPAASFRLRTSVKATGLLSRAPDAPLLFPERVGGESMWRVRAEPEITAGARAVFTLAYEQRVRLTSGTAGVTTAGILPSQGAAPFRIRQLDWTIARSSGVSWQHEIDRASVQLQSGRASLTLGRQAIGWGRGVMFGAVDLFAPFSPLEVDREWRRGVDAARADITLTDRSSLDLVGAFGNAWDRSAVGARVRGYAGPIDVEFMGGRRARDLFAGVTSSAAVGSAGIHGELAAFHVPDDGTSGGERTVWKGVAGGSYRFPIGAGILTYVEYHYSGFGAARPEDIVPLLSRASFSERYLRGDTQILSRHAVAVIASYEPSPELLFSGQWIQNPRDRSGILAPSLTLTLSDQASIVGSLYLPYGRPPRGQLLRSEFGAAPLAALMQLRLYL